MGAIISANHSLSTTRPCIPTGFNILSFGRRLRPQVSCIARIIIRKKRRYGSSSRWRLWKKKKKSKQNKFTPRVIMILYTQALEGKRVYSFFVLIAFTVLVGLWPLRTPYSVPPSVRAIYLKVLQSGYFWLESILDLPHQRCPGRLLGPFRFDISVSTVPLSSGSFDLHAWYTHRVFNRFSGHLSINDCYHSQYAPFSSASRP